MAIRRITEAYGQGNILVNGQKIEWSNTSAEGALTIYTELAAGLGVRRLNAFWTAACIADEAQILSLRIDSVGDNLFHTESGFTISFKQEGQPEVLRLVGQPVDISQPQDLGTQWTHPDPSQRLELTPLAHDSSQSDLEDELIQIEALRSQRHDLQKLIGQKKHRVHQLLRDDFVELCSMITKCDSIRCLFRTIANKLSDYARIVSVHCLHHHPKQTASSGDITKQVEGPSTSDESEAPTDGSGSVPTTLEGNDDEPGVSHHDEISSTPVIHHENASHSPIPSHTRQVSPTSTPSNHANDLLPPTPSYNTTSISSQSNYDLHPQYYLLIRILPLLLLVTIVGGFVFISLLYFKLLCASDRCRARRSACREERRTRRAYRRAARQHSWRNWWNRYRRPSCNGDYEEKRTLLLEQEGILEDAMQHHINHLVTEHESRSDIACAEEGRARFCHQNSTLQQQYPTYGNAIDFAATSLASSSSSSSPSSSSSSSSSPSAPSSSSSATTPSFRTFHSNPLPRLSSRASSPSSHSSHSHLPPPSYDQELGDDIDVVDGFTYSPTFGAGQNISYSHSHILIDGYGEREGDDTTPDSSVVDCSPRMSFDTGRSTYTITTVGKDTD